MQSNGGEASHNDALVAFVPLAETSDSAIRVLELRGAHAFSFRVWAPTERLTERRDALGDGPWLYEPDVVRFGSRGQPERTLLRDPLTGGWCAFVDLPEDHPLFDVRLPAFDGGRSALDQYANSWDGRRVRRIGFTIQPRAAIPMLRMLPDREYRDVWQAAAQAMRLANTLETIALSVPRRVAG